MEEEYIRSPLNYIGGKYRLLDDILPLFPSDINTFVDLFGGGFDVGINVKAKKVVYNDKCKEVAQFLNCLKEKEIKELLNEIDKYIESYGLTKYNREGYLALREDYNKEKSPMKFYTLICFAFNNQIRFNRKGEYNMTFGEGRSSFNPTLREKFIRFHKRIREIDDEFLSSSFERFPYYMSLTAHDLVYCDPPYFSSIATYSEHGKWAERHEDRLLKILDFLNERGVRFALSNNLKYENPLLKAWKNKYKVHYLYMNYSNCNYQKIDRSIDIEVLITNY